jgi:hypothetical protein
MCALAVLNGCLTSLKIFFIASSMSVVMNDTFDWSKPPIILDSELGRRFT